MNFFKLILLLIIASVLQVDAYAQLDYIGTPASRNMPFGGEECAKKCGKAPRLIDLPAPYEIGFDSAISTALQYNRCLNNCGMLSKKNDISQRTKEMILLGNNSVILKELDSCKSKIQILQEKQPNVFDRLMRDVKQINENNSSPVIKTNTVQK